MSQIKYLLCLLAVLVVNIHGQMYANELATPGAYGSTGQQQECLGLSEYHCSECGSRVLPELYSEIQQHSECQSITDEDCLVGSSVVKRTLFEDVKQGRCTLQCYGTESIRCFPAPDIGQDNFPPPLGQDIIPPFDSPPMAPVNLAPDNPPQPTNDTCVDCPCTVCDEEGDLNIDLSVEFNLKYSSFGHCTTNCTSDVPSVQERSAQCVETATSLPVSLDTCASALEEAKQNFTQACNSTADCDAYAWKAGGWSLCSSTCGQGEQTQTVDCAKLVDGQEVLVPEDSDEYSNCPKLTKPLTLQPCLMPTCQQLFYRTGEWTECDGEQRSRSVECVDRNTDSTRPTEDCFADLDYTPTQVMVCDLDHCKVDFDCNNRGVCTDGKCVCDEGFTDDQCQITVDDCQDGEICCSTGVVDKDGNCCDSGLVSIVDGQCCLDDGTRDKFCDCCPGSLDPLTGECNVRHESINIFSGQGCDNILDPQGRCVPKGVSLDQCGIPHGNSTTCDCNCGATLEIDADVDVQVTTNGTISEETQLGLDQIKEQITQELGVNVTNIDIQVIEQQSGRKLLDVDNIDNIVNWFASRRQNVRRLQQDGKKQKKGKKTVDLLITIHPDGQNSLTYNKVNEAIKKVQVKKKGQKIKVKDIGVISYAGRKNGWCEVNEPDNGDCLPTEQLDVPKDKMGRACGGNGTPKRGLGVCECWTGFAGDDCSECAEGYKYSAKPHTCVPTFTNLQTLFSTVIVEPQNDIHSGKSTPRSAAIKSSDKNNGNILIWCLCGAGIALLMAVALLSAARYRKRSANKHKVPLLDDNSDRCSSSFNMSIKNSGHSLDMGQSSRLLSRIASDKGKQPLNQQQFQAQQLMQCIIQNDENKTEQNKRGAINYQFVGVDELQRPILPIPDDPFYARKLEKQKIEQGLEMESPQASFYIASGQYTRARADSYSIQNPLITQSTLGDQSNQTPLSSIEAPRPVEQENNRDGKPSEYYQESNYR